MSVPSITLRTGPDLLAVVPYLIGEPPADVVAFVFLTEDPQQVGCATYPLTDALDPAEVLPHVQGTLARLGARAVAVAAYGPRTTRPALARLISALRPVVPVAAAFLADSGRCYCLTCDTCSQAIEGVPFDPAATSAAAEATFAGLAAPAPRPDLAAPDPRLQAQTAALLTGMPVPARPGHEYRQLIDALADGVPVTPARAALLAVLLTDHDVRDVALREVLRWPSPVGMWLDVVRCLPDAYLATSGNLAGIAAWKADKPRLACALFDRVLAVHPADTLSRSMSQVMGLGISFRDAYQALMEAQRRDDQR
ncbi:DUF4192 family protein [Catelliglobosispora koreensis]|uniref:DUF4192 family protein n=1 Tax=Catelliglobosispora koreensis TaxID=129052 RepID=UPI00037926E4|nr:DUF4192 family protein [Catelliglobosispora koreensis]